MENEGREKERERKRLTIVCAIVIVGVLICTLSPFNPFLANQVSWLPQANGIRFGTHGVVTSRGLLVAAPTEATTHCSLELLLQPAEAQWVYTILSFYSPDNPGQFRVRQWTDGLLVSHDVFDAESKIRRQKFDVDHAFRPGQLLLLTLASGQNGTVVYLNGRKRQIVPRFTISQAELSGQIILGTSAIDYHPWHGEIRGLAIYSKPLTPEDVFRHYQTWTAQGSDAPDLTGAVARYDFAERTGQKIQNSVSSGPDLEIPARFKVPNKPFLESPTKEFEASRAYLKDLLENIVGFVPVGFVFCAYFGVARGWRNAILWSVLAGGLMSFGIEVLQFFIPRRGSGLTDVVTNTLGAALGAVLARPNSVRKILRKTDSLVGGGKTTLRSD
jgi:VanZ family protein